MTDQTCYFSVRLEWPTAQVEQLMATYWMVRTGNMPLRTRQFLEQLIPEKTRRTYLIDDMTTAVLNVAVAQGDSHKTQIVTFSGDDDHAPFPLAALLCAFMAERKAIAFQPITFTVNFIHLWDESTGSETWRVDAERIACLRPAQLMGEFPENAIPFYFTMAAEDAASRVGFLLERLAPGLTDKFAPDPE